ncbi:type II restriction endonuclease [Lactiplantibacillus pentosus]|uniref:type II restriction endonuclease n=1 Tax=Lactiplantibacillus pentosus TaxID=1589 RepID=UPI0023492B6B|nr:type II restriction endonuclease [Lactiplantibacillus pentosus]MDC6396740.1 type II restriction endonuclease [Lactiplantibacillus pentosus]
MDSKKIIKAIQEVLPTDPDSWKILGFFNTKQEILSFGNDSKILGRLFEVIIQPYLKQAAQKLGYTLGESSSQTVYPDFWFITPKNRLIAIDIKSTYRKGKNGKIGFTLGGYGSFLRNNTKNIYRTYSDYDLHLIIGFVYTRTSNPTKGVSTVQAMSTIVPPYKNVQLFVQEKYKIGGQKKGSGNTNNIGTLTTTNINDFIEGNGYFAALGKDAFEDYWRHYPLYTDNAATKKSLYTNLEEYFSWLDRKGSHKKSTELKSIYDKWKLNPRSRKIH